MWTRLFSTFIAAALLFFMLAGAGGFAAISSQPTKLDQTDRALDLAIAGEGYFGVKLPASQGGAIAYTRAGNFVLGSGGEIALGSEDGPRLQSALAIPPNTSDIRISPDGTVSVLVAGETARRKVGQIAVVRFAHWGVLRTDPANPQLLLPRDATNAASEDPQADHGSARVLQGFLERIN